MMHITTYGRGRGRSSEYKVYIGWKHHSRNAYRVVTSAKDGGTRTITCKAAQEKAFAEILETGK